MEEIAKAKSLYSYIDDTGTSVITDDVERIPPRYRARVIKIEQEADEGKDRSRGSTGGGGLLKRIDRSIENATISIPGMTHYQSHALTIAGGLALLCLGLRNFTSSQVLRFLALWGLIMLGLVTPVYVFLSQDAPLDILRGNASQLQSKQQEHLKHAPQ